LALLKPFLEIPFTSKVSIPSLNYGTVEYEPEPMSFDGFGTILTADMKVDLLII
jgi:hypothetical protein